MGLNDTTTTKYGVRIVTVDPTTNKIQATTRTGGAVNVQLVSTPIAWRWPVPGEGWMARQENGAWYLDGPMPDPNSTAEVTLWDVPVGDAVINSPTGVMHVLGSETGDTDFSLSAAVLAGIEAAIAAAVAAATGKAGDLVPSGASIRAGCLLCDGTSYATATYPTLHTAIGYAYGGSGANFNVPNLIGRVPVGAGTGTAAGSTAHALGAQPTTGVGGEATHALSVGELASHNHGGSTGGGSTGTGSTGTGSTYGGTTGGESNSHTHTPTSGGTILASGLGTPADITYSVSPTGFVLTGLGYESSGHTHSVPGQTVPSLSVPSLSVPALSISSAGSSTAHNIMPPISAVNWFIVTG
jgi:microcystin-dependent protein